MAAKARAMLPAVCTRKRQSALGNCFSRSLGP